MIAIRRARPADAMAIAAVHVAAWRSTYPGILPDSYLAKLSVSRQAAYYDAAIRGATGVFVATASGWTCRPGSPDRSAAGQAPAAARASSASPPPAGRGPPARSAGAAWAKARSRRSTCWTTGASAASAAA